MRIITGSAKGTRLKMVSGKHVRPTADHVKESFFQVIGPFFEGGLVLDLFCGTGALGLEAVSRGADRAILIDSSRASCKVARANAQAARLSAQVEIYRSDVLAGIRKLNKRQLKFDYIFMDPPYMKNLLTPVIEKLSFFDLLTEDGIIVAEHSSLSIPPQEIGSYQCYRRLNYGDTVISLFEKAE
ncbi:16S rRNA (guanine(966)-N(2))-methyltransferase RsmD [Thermoactinomyces sp. AMNI-1]|uniref:16S rRNA (Guanine(966)-N(2))-methyltransferase RsmD n=2 Tax=Thermoactinomyces mirandus TaxID=2756294 RepID=A0A7W1XSE1_9BACL|nr:16S rRNA (guanine(966)-N(2))-methyltransferase RsmD [Thermoactinomyces mirandus]